MGGQHDPNPQRFMLWIDAVGGYRVCLDDEVVLGQPAGTADLAVPILGDLSARHARIRRDGEGYLLEPLRPVWVNHQPVAGQVALTDGAEIQLGPRVRLVFRQPHLLSATARLEFASPHRTQPPCDGVLLLADTCILGPAGNSHIVCRTWEHEVVLFRHSGGLFCRTAGPWLVDGQPGHSRQRLALDTRVSGPGFSFALEALGRG